MMNLMQAIQ